MKQSDMMQFYARIRIIYFIIISAGSDALSRVV